MPLHQSIDACIHDVCKQDTFRYKSIWTLDRLNAIGEARRAHQIQYRRSYQREESEQGRNIMSCNDHNVRATHL